MLTRSPEQASQRMPPPKHGRTYRRMDRSLTYCLPWPIGWVVEAHTHKHPFNGPFPGLPRSAGTRKVKPLWILLKQETVSSSGISWAISKSAPCSRQITTPAPHHSVFLQAGYPSCHPTNSVKGLKASWVVEA